jgi:hypothetical protein
LSNVLKTLEFIDRWVRMSGVTLGEAVRAVGDMIRESPVRLAEVSATRGVAQRSRRDQSRPV